MPLVIRCRALSKDVGNGTEIASRVGQQAALSSLEDRLGHRVKYCRGRGG